MPSMTVKQYEVIRHSALLANVRVRDDALSAGLESAMHAALEGSASSIDESLARAWTWRAAHRRW